MRQTSGSTPEQRLHTSLPHARMIPKSCSKSAAIEGVATPAINIGTTDNHAPTPVPSQTVCRCLFHLLFLSDPPATLELPSLPDTLPEAFPPPVQASSCRPPAHPSARQQDRKDEVGHGRRPKQHVNVHPANTDVDEIDGGEQAQRDKRRERLPVFALERARPAPESKTHHHQAGNPTDEIPGRRVHLRPEQQPGKQRWRNDQAGPRRNFEDDCLVEFNNVRLLGNFYS